MTFRQCVIIALSFHMALMLCPLKGHIEGKKRNVVLVVTERPSITASSAVESREEPLPQPVKQEVLQDKKEEVQPAPRRIVKPEKPSIEKVCREEPVRKKPPKKEKKEKPVKDAKTETKISRSTVPLKSEPKIDAVAKRVVPECSMPLREVLAQKSSIAVTSTPETVIDQPLEVAFGSAEGPRFKRRTLPEYPLKARRLGKTGVVVLMLTIDAEGGLIDVEVLKKSGHGFDEAAIAAVESSLFMAARRDGKPFACKAMLPVRFKLR